MKAMARWVGLGVALAGSAAMAHDADVIYAQLSHAGDALLEAVTLTPGALAELAPLDADGDGTLTQADLDARQAALKAGVWDDAPLTAGGQPCTRSAETAVLKEGYVALEARFRCGEGELRQDFRFLRVLPPNFRVALGSQFDGERGASGFAAGGATSITLPRPGRFSGSTWASAVERGLERGARASSLLALVAVLVSMGSLGRGLRALGLGLAGMIAGVWLEAPALVVAVGLALLSTVMTFVREDAPVGVGALLGVGLGLSLGGGGFPSALGAVGGALVLWIPVGVGGAALALMLRRRARLWRWARWALPLAAWASVIVR